MGATDGQCSPSTGTGNSGVTVDLRSPPSFQTTERYISEACFVHKRNRPWLHLWGSPLAHLVWISMVTYGRGWQWASPHFHLPPGCSQEQYEVTTAIIIFLCKGKLRFREGE